MKCVKIVFSPTGGTDRAAEIITAQWGIEAVTVDLCDRNLDFSQRHIHSDDLALIAIPSWRPHSKNSAHLTDADHT